MNITISQVLNNKHVSYNLKSNYCEITRYFKNRKDLDNEFLHFRCIHELIVDFLNRYKKGSIELNIIYSYPKLLYNYLNFYLLKKELKRFSSINIIDKFEYSNNFIDDGLEFIDDDLGFIDEYENEYKNEYNEYKNEYNEYKNEYNECKNEYNEYKNDDLGFIDEYKNDEYKKKNINNFKNEFYIL